MKVNLSLDDINILIYRYLLENGYTHSAFTFSNEASISKNPYYSTHSEKMPTNALISFIQKAMIYVYIEYHTDENTGNRVPCDESFSLFKKHSCYRKVGSNSGFPNESDERNEIDIDTKGDPYIVPYDYTSQVYLGPPHRRFQDKWLLSGFYNLFTPENSTCGHTIWNPSIETHLLTISIGGSSFISYEKPNNKGYDYKILSNNDNINSTIGCFRYDGNVIATGYEDGRCCIWSNEGNLLDTLKLDSAITAMAFSGNALNPEMNDDQTERLAIAGVNGSLSIYELASDGTFRNVDNTKFQHCIVHLAWRDHTILSLVSNNLEDNESCISLYNTIESKSTDITPENTSQIFIKTIWDREGTSLAIIGDVLYIYHVNTNLHDKLEHRDKVIDADWAYGFSEKASKRLVTCCADKLITLWDVVSRSIINTAVLDHIPTCLSLSRNSSLLAVATFGAILKVFALPGLILKCSIQESKLITNISWSCDTNSLCYNLYKSGKTTVLPLRIFTQYE